MSAKEIVKISCMRGEKQGYCSAYLFEDNALLWEGRTGASSHFYTDQANEQLKMQGQGIQQQKTKLPFLADTSDSSHNDSPYTKGGHLGHLPWEPKGFDQNQSTSVLGTVQLHIDVTSLKSTHGPSNWQSI